MSSDPKLEFEKSTPMASLNGTIRVDESMYQVPHSGQRKASLTVIRSGADLGMHVFIEDRIIIGRDAQCSFPLQDHRVSRQHISITPLSDDRYLIKDLGSTNGTRVNGELLAVPQLLMDGDKIALGDTVIRFILADELDIDYQSEVSLLVGTDPLTGLPSKRRFDESFEYALQTASRTGQSVALLMMDMDGLKKINDTHGHLFGAHSISCGGRLIADVVRGLGQACRFGGDEFSAFLVDHSFDKALEVAERIRMAIDQAGMQKDGIALHPTISIGVACFPECGKTSLELTQASDMALYRAKAKGKNCVCT